METFAARALARLLRGPLTHWDYLAQTGSYRLSRDVFALRESGWPVASTAFSRAVHDSARGRTVVRTFARYTLAADRLGIAPQRLAAFVAAVTTREAT